MNTGQSDSLTDQVIVVTGGAGLLGRAFVDAIADQGATAVIATRNLDKAMSVAEASMADAPGRKIDCIGLDISDPPSVAELFPALHETHGRVDALVNNALPRNDNYGRKFEDVAYADFCENVDSHLGGYVLMCQAAVKYFTEQAGGNIVNMGSIYGTIAPHFDVYEDTDMTKEIEYAIAKAGIIHLSQYLAAYCKGRNIRVNTLSPGGIFDDQPEPFVARYSALCLNKGMLAPEDVTGALLFLLSDQSKYVNGHNLVVDDGFLLGP